MMKINTIISSLAVLGVLTLGAGYADANSLGHNNYGNNHASVQLSEEQQSKLDVMCEDNYNTMRPLRSELRAKRMELKALRNNGNASPEYISKLAKEITVLNDKMEDNHMAFSKDVESKLGIEYSAYGHRMSGRDGMHGKYHGRGNGQGHGNMQGNGQGHGNMQGNGQGHGNMQGNGQGHGNMQMHNNM